MMRVLLIGAYGLIGEGVASALAAAGHRVTGLGRSAATGRRLVPGIAWIEADVAKLATAEHWRSRLDGIDAVVNASGALQSGPRDDLGSLQRDAVAALVTAMDRWGPKRLIQISAPGAKATASTEFLRTKGEGDDAIRASQLDWIILQPGLVIAPTAYGGTSLLRATVAMPLVQPVIHAERRVQTVALEDVAQAVVLVLSDETLTRKTFALVEDAPHRIKDLTLSLRRWLGFAAPLAVWPVPGPVGIILATFGDVAGYFGWRSPMRSTALKVLSEDVVADPAPWRASTGLGMRDLGATLAALPATAQERMFARVSLLFPIAVVAFAIFWIASGAVGLWQREAAALVLAPVMDAGAARFTVIAASLLDIGIGAGLLFRRTFQAACLGAAGVSAGYLALATLLAPGLWADPLGPWLKIVPIIVLSLMLAAAGEER